MIVLCAPAFLHASSAHDTLLEGLSGVSRCTLSEHIDALDDTMREAIQNAGFAPQERQIVIEHAQDITPKRLPLLKAALAPFVGDFEFRRNFLRANALPDDMLQAIANTHFTPDVLRNVFTYIHLFQPAHIAHLPAWCNGVPEYEQRALLEKAYAKAPEEIARVAGYGLGPRSRVLALERGHLFPADKKDALSCLLKDHPFDGLDIAQAAQSHSSKTLTLFADQEFDHMQRAALLGTNILDLPSEKLPLAKEFLRGIRGARDIVYGVELIFSTPQDDLSRVVGANFAPCSRLSILRNVQQLEDAQLHALRPLLTAYPHVEAAFMDGSSHFLGDTLVEKVAKQKHTPETMLTLCDRSFSRSDVSTILSADAETVCQKVPLLKELVWAPEKILELEGHISINSLVHKSVEELQTMLVCFQAIAQETPAPYQRVAFMKSISSLTPDKIKRVYLLLNGITHYYDADFLVRDASKLSVERLDLLARSHFSPNHISAVIEYLPQADPALYPDVQTLLSGLSKVEGTHLIKACVGKTQEQLKEALSLPADERLAFLQQASSCASTSSHELLAR
ncbi:MAG: hypothetical protein C0514_06570 [Candidatus Puniceispirillum sp.]|nr:hypothetical protein [Candidatus Puniceispirillum sp.]